MHASPLTLCNNVLRRGCRDNVPISPMKLQKLMYFICRDYLQCTGEELISENFGVWQYGPVLLTVYDEFKACKAGPIKDYVKTAGGKAYQIDEDENPVLSGIIDSVWEKYKSLSAVELSNLTHLDDSGWSMAFSRNSPKISNEDMMDDTTG